ncbi:very-long-chain (3R)-3-hydroxyacyl-CoA dehydratase 1 [Stigmatopora argus]
MASSEEDGGAASEEKESNNLKRGRGKGTVATAWLTFYNIAMTAGWLVLAMTMMRFYMQKGTHKGLYRSIARTLKFFQTFALVEVGHCAIGLIRTSVIVTGVQVSSRIFMVWFVTSSIRQIQNEESVVLFLVVWTLTEITRYSYYTFNLLHHLPYFIKWARYTLFIVLYPLGVLGELLTIYSALPFVRRSGMYSMRLPNKYNVSFDYHYCLVIIMLSYIPLFPQLFFHMLRQRRRVLHGEVIVEKDD